MAQPASASVIYEYTGNDFTIVSGSYTTAMKVTVTLTLAQPLLASQTFLDVVPESYSFNDGVQTLTTGGQFRFSTDASGSITAWVVDAIVLTPLSRQTMITTLQPGVTTDSGSGITCSVAPFGCPGPNEVILTNQTGSNLNDASIWRVAAVPEPSTWAMAILGFVGIGAMTYRRRKSAMLAA
jgi:hypothetical protein